MNLTTDQLDRLRFLRMLGPGPQRPLDKGLIALGLIEACPWGHILTPKGYGTLIGFTKYTPLTYQ